MNHEHDFSDAELSQAIGASDTNCVPSQQHLDSLRSKLLLQTQHPSPHAYPNQLAAPESSLDRGRRRRRTWLQLASLAALIAVAIFAAMPLAGNASADLASSLNAMRREIWVHATTTIDYMGNSLDSEAWYAPQSRIAAFRTDQSQHFVDYQAGVQSSHISGSDQIYRWRADPRMENFGSAFVQALLTESDLSALFPQHRVSHVQKRALLHAGTPSIEYRFQTVWKQDSKMQIDTVVIADRDSRRIVWWEESHAGGKRIVTRFDYPDAGPRDLYALGAKPDAEVIDRVASSDVVELASKYHNEILNFDDYSALVVDRLTPAATSDTSASPPRAVLLRRIIRHGREFRVDLVDPNSLDLPDDEELSLDYWKAQEHQWNYVPLAVCDGEACRLYPAPEGSIPAELSGEFCSGKEKVQSMPATILKSARGETAIPVWPGLWPEYACRPLIMPSDPSVIFEVDPSGAEGPEQTIKLQVLTPDHPFATVRASYWLSLKHDHCLARSITLRPTFTKHSTRPAEESVESSFALFARSPSGISYATRRLTIEPGNSMIRQTDFIIDFTR